MNIIEKASMLNRWIDESTVITTVCHARPDGDAAGSSVAVAAYLTACRGKDAVAVFPDTLPATLDFITDGTDTVFADSEPEAAKKRIESSDLLICLDFNTMSRTEALEEAVRSFSGRKVLVDHHEDPRTEEFDLCFSETAVSSTCELLYEILLTMPDIRSDASALPKQAAVALMSGMTTDTNNFANSVHPGTLKMASELLAAGVDRDAIIDHIYCSERPNRLAAQGEMLSRRLRLLPEGVACAVLDDAFMERHALRDGETEGFVNMPLAIRDIRLSVLAREDKGFFRVSVRSKRGVSARALARDFFHGGGHEQASGGRIFIPSDVPSPDQVEAYIERITARFMHENASAEKQ
ncbi:MAG: DHH family phosphoesterase [Bacteroidales bacterium]|nr:DHH family phosphoesterase [Bacteroidales bacterium]